MSDTNYYFLMHQNNNCAILEFNSITGGLVNYDVTDKALMPMNGRADIRSLNNWWIHRPFPSTREDMKQVLKRAGASNPETYLLKNLALSMTDTYWICPVEEPSLQWDDVKLTNQISLGKTNIPFHNIDTYDPNASLGGQMSKHWDLSNNPPVLVKRAIEYDSQQAVNEVFATLIHSRQPKAPEYVSYKAYRDPQQNKFLLSSCATFVEPGLEFLPAYEIGTAEDRDLSDYDKYIKAWVNCGMDETKVREFFDYQTITDFILSNVDRHLANFGALRRADTLEFIKPAPIYDSGNSMFFSEFNTERFLSKPELLNRNIVSIYDKEEKMMARVQNKNIVDLDALPTKEETKELYLSYGIPEAKVDFIVDAYQKKIEMTREFQKGKSVSMFSETGMKYKKNTIRWCSSPSTLSQETKPSEEHEPEPDTDDDIDI